MLNSQLQCFNSIKALCSNYKKDGADRKTEEYLLIRLKSLEDQWRDFEERHRTILDTYEDKNIPYFTEDVFTKTMELYETTKKSMENLLKQKRERKTVHFDLIGMLDDTTDASVRSLLEQQECNFKALDRVMSKIDIQTIVERWELQDYLSIMKSKWDIIDKLHWELEVKLKGSNLKYYNMFTAIEGRYDDLRRQLNTKIWSTTHYEKSAPKIQIPEFSGSYTQWISFKDLFLETIHNNPMINKAQKMQHLKTKLRGEAERLVQHLSISADAYDSCWEILIQRYDNRRLQFTSFINTMLNLPVIQNADSYNLKKMHDVITECLNGLSNIDIDTSTWDPLIVHLMLQKLDTSTYSDYMKEQQDHRELPHLNNFLYFLESKFMAYETMKNAKKEITIIQKQNQPKNINYKNFAAKKEYHETKKTYNKSYFTTPFFGQCPNCNGNHVMMQCPKFIDMNATQRNNTVARLHLCENCLYSHGNAKCNSNKTCKECNMRHHTLLHNPAKRILPTSTETTYNGKNHSCSRPSTSTQLSSNHLNTDKMEIILTTVQLHVLTANGNYVTLRALLDQGSQVNLITEGAAQLLRQPRQRVVATVSGVGAAAGDCQGSLQLTCKSIHSDYSFKTEALIMKKLINNLPNTSFKTANWPHLENLKLADPEFNVSRPVDLLLGAGVYSDIILDGVLKGSQQSPTAQQTHLGWILCGKLTTFNCYVTLVDLNDITKYWEHEDITHDDKDISKDDYCESHYSRTVQRGSDGKYIVQMPFVPHYEEKLGKSKPVAISQYLQLEKRFLRKNKLAAMYIDFINEYIDLRHMKPSMPSTTTSIVKECYLPHHGVLREHSTTTKLRVVFNASQKTSSGFSLNDLQEKGHNLQKDIQALILKWRSYKYAYTADIEKMYRCLQLCEDQQKLQKIIWRSSTGKLQDYQLCTVTYGMKSAPWLALRTLKQLAIDDGHMHPKAAHVLQNQFYVDDLIGGENSIAAATQLQLSLIELLRGGGMNLRKWSANHPKLLQNLSEEQISTTNIFDFKHEEPTKTLGLGWNPKSDTFTFNWNLENQQPIMTKRQLLSDISKLYDPLGWLSPVTVTAKLLFQRVWVSKLGWDETLPAELLQEWKKLKTDLPLVKNIKLNRWLGGTQDNIELLAFCDASEKAYSCVIYSRIVGANGPPIITLLAAKTRVAPLANKTTLPRLELCGAMLLAQLIEKTKESFKGHQLEVQAWSDSQVVLVWLEGDVSRWERYVANRVTKIKQVIPSKNWHYVKSELNPANCATRGLHPSKLINFGLWWNGPDFLQTFRKEETPKKPVCFTTTNVEVKLSKLKEATLAEKPNINFINELLIKCSSLTRVTRVMAWVLRFVANLRNDMKLETNYLTASELTFANKTIIKYVQRYEFENEYKLLRKKQFISNKSTIYKLTPYLDDEEIIRVGGRLNNSALPSEMKNPIILSRSGRFTKLLIGQAHLTTLHGGARLTLSYIRQRYWIVGGNRAVKDELRHCVRCHRHKPMETYQLMGDLPQQRITPSRPFTHTGVDFTGHVEMKLNKGRGVKTSKGYIAIFVCMATKAVHIELVSDLSTETFIAAFQRMCARRGAPKHVYSDCGTNFTGAAKVLRKEFEEFKQLLSPEFFDNISKLEVEWHFNAPAWPTAGGLWEAAVKSLKYHLRRVVGDQKLTYEEFSTLLAQIEACLNSRPLCPLTEDPEEFYNYLTPGHFLTGGPTLSLPLSDYSDVRTLDLRRRWQLTENMLQQFWRSWSNEYLTQLQGRSKWNKPTKNIKEGDIVLVRDNNLPPGKWAMGRILELHPGSDGLVRVTTLKTQTGVMKRPITKLSPLPLKNENSENEITTKEQINLQKKRRIKTGKTAFRTLFTSLITMIIITTGARANVLSSSARITSLEPDRPIYYDTLGTIQIIHDEWTLPMYYNLTNYWNNVQRIESYLRDLADLCENTDPRYCKPTLEQLSHEMELLNYYNSILLAPHKHLTERKKRGLINGVGSIANQLFGVLDQQFADNYQKDIAAVQNNENYLLELIKNQTSIVELENKVLKKTEDNINKQLNIIDGFMNQTDANFAKIESAVEVMMATTYFTSASFATYLLLKNMRSMQEMLFDSLTDVYKGHMDVHLLSPVDLLDQLNLIAGKLPKSLTLPVENVREDMKDIYKLLYVRARVTTTYFLFEVHVPLTSTEDFSLYRAIPLPVKTETRTTTVVLQSEFIAINFYKNNYISLTENIVKHCTQLKKDRYICYKNLPVFNFHNNNAPCEAKLLSHGSNSTCDVRDSSCDDAWIALHSPNSWLAVCCGACTLRTICDTAVTSHTMTTSSIVTLAQGCILQTKDFTIYSHNEYNTNMKMDRQYEVHFQNATVNNIVNIAHQRTSARSQHNASGKDTQEIDKKLLSLKEHELLPTTISTHDVNYYTICYILLGAAILGTFVWVIRNYGCVCCKRKEEISGDMELQHRGKAPARPAPAPPAPPATTTAADNVAFNFEE